METNIKFHPLHTGAQASISFQAAGLLKDL